MDSRPDVERSPLRVLHLAGSVESGFHHDLSRLYAAGAVRPPGVEACFALGDPARRWRFGERPELLGAEVALGELMGRLRDIDVVVPHMFCAAGMTSFRAFFEDVVGIPVVGSGANTNALAADKQASRQLAGAAGVEVADGELLVRGERPSLSPPFIIKPNREDNSLGLSLVRESSDIDRALELGFRHDSQLLCEAFIPGREVRLAVIERDGELHVPPAIEYLVDAEHPIRTTRDKLDLDAEGRPVGQPRAPGIPPRCPAALEPELAAALAADARALHRAFACRDYSLFDFRVRECDQRPVFLEAGLFWSFSPRSMISRMLAAAGEDLESWAGAVWRAAARGRVTGAR